MHFLLQINSLTIPDENTLTGAQSKTCTKPYFP